ncbi:MAG: hypothetical protein M1816_004796 [Peltula sp. TS41687]|nr:MAG: hypothetical protein M1816_004796 [Peltula sp. TS41687]
MRTSIDVAVPNAVKAKHQSTGAAIQQLYEREYQGVGQWIDQKLTSAPLNMQPLGTRPDAKVKAAAAEPDPAKPDPLEDIRRVVVSEHRFQWTAMTRPGSSKEVVEWTDHEIGQRVDDWPARGPANI